jgi:hypothetical protein
LNAAFDDVHAPRQAIVDRVLAHLADDVDDLKDELMARANEIAAAKTAELVKIGAKEAAALRKLLEDQLGRIEKRLGTTQQTFDFDEAERRQKRDDERHMVEKRAALAAEMESAPAAVAASYEVQASRIEPLGVVYLWPRSG